MVYSTGEAGGDANLFLRRWDGTVWGPPRPMRALNSAFHETAPALSGDGNFLYFVSDRPGGRGGDDIWVAKWDGAEYAWPLPLTGRVNTPFDETDPALSPGRLTTLLRLQPPLRVRGTGDQGRRRPARDILADVQRPARATSISTPPTSPATRPST